MENDSIFYSIACVPITILKLIHVLVITKKKNKLQINTASIYAIKLFLPIKRQSFIFITKQIVSFKQRIFTFTFLVEKYL